MVKSRLFLFYQLLAITYNHSENACISVTPWSPSSDTSDGGSWSVPGIRAQLREGEEHRWGAGTEGKEQHPLVLHPVC